MSLNALIVLYVAILLDCDNLLYVRMVKHLHDLELVGYALILISVLLIDELDNVVCSSLVDASTLFVHVLVRCDKVFIIQDPPFLPVLSFVSSHICMVI